MSKDEEYVRSVWVRVDNSSSPAPLYFVYGLQWACSDDNEEGAWSAAAEFTRTRLEQVRQLREEIALVGVSIEGAEYGNNAWHKVVASRTLARLEAELTTMTLGMKPGALGVTR